MRRRLVAVIHFETCIISETLSGTTRPRSTRFHHACLTYYSHTFGDHQLLDRLRVLKPDRNTINHPHAHEHAPINYHIHRSHSTPLAHTHSIMASRLSLSGVVWCCVRECVARDQFPCGSKSATHATQTHRAHTADRIMFSWNNFTYHLMDDGTRRPVTSSRGWTRWYVFCA